MPDGQTPEVKAPPPLKNQLKAIHKEFQTLNGKDGIRVDTIGTGKDQEVDWQRVRYGEELNGSDKKLFRGYLMIQPDDLPQTLRILDEIGQLRLKEGKTTQFKWLVKQDSPEFKTNKDYQLKETGDYELVESDTPMIAIYADEAAEIQEILGSLAGRPEWAEIEQRRIDSFKDQEVPTHGSSEFELEGKKFKTLNFNEKPGHAEKKGPEKKDEETDLLTPQELIDLVMEGARGVPEATGDLLELMAHNGNIGEVIRQKGENLMTLAKTDREKFAGLDLQRSGLIRSVLDETSKKSKTKETSNVKAEKLKEIDEEWQKMLKKDRSLMDESMISLAKSLDISPEKAFADPIGEIQSYLTKTFNDKKLRENLQKQLGDLGLLPEKTGAISNTLNHERHKEQMKKSGKKAAIAGGAVGLLMMLSAWMALKTEGAQQRGR